MRTAFMCALALLAPTAFAQTVTDHSAHQHASAPAPTTPATSPTESHDGEQDMHEHEHHAEQPPVEAASDHVPPDPPTHPLPDMSQHEMAQLMQMDDTATYGKVLLDQLEWSRVAGQDRADWELQAWYGNDYDKIWLQSEGERLDGESEGRAEVMWDHLLSRWWSIQTGIRQDFGAGPSRTWADIGFQGLAPYFFEIDAGLYVGEGGRTALRFSGEYDVLLTQRLILQPEIEFNIYGKDDARNEIGSGLSNAELGLRLRYEIRREVAPYVGLRWERKFGDTADIVRRTDGDVSDLSLIAGMRVWF